MLVNIFNSFNPTQFLIDSPLWVSFIAHGIMFVICLGLSTAVIALIIRDKEARIGFTMAVSAVLVVFGGIWELATLTEVFKHAGVNEGYPLVLAVIVGVISNILVVAIIARTVFAAHGFIQAHLSSKS
jgi:hypothetical protein